MRSVDRSRREPSSRLRLPQTVEGYAGARQGEAQAVAEKITLSKQRSSRSTLTLVFAGASLFIASLAIFFWQEQQSYRPLLSGSDIFRVDTFFVYTPDSESVFIPAQFLSTITVKENIIRDTKTNSFTREPGTIETTPFIPTRYMAIPILGGAQNPAIFDLRQARVYLRCLSSAAELDLLHGPSEGWFLATIQLPLHWCEGPVTVNAKSADSKYRIGLGTPFEIRWLTWAVSGRLGAFAAALLAFSLIVLTTIPIMAIGRFDLVYRLAFVVIAPSVFGYALFVQQWYIGNQGLSALVEIVSIFSPLALFCYFTRNEPQRIDNQSAIIFLSALAITFFVALFAPYAFIPIQNGFWFPAYAFFPASWSTDNLLSMMTAKSVLAAGHVHPDFLGAWSLTDRGIIQAGNFVGLFTLPFIADIVSKSVAGLYVAHFYGASIQALAVPVIVVLVSRRMVLGADWITLALLLASTPFFLMNTFYIWPKLSGGILVIMAFFLLWKALREDSAFALCASALALFLAAMNHSANIMSLLTVVFYCALSIAVGHHTYDEVKRLARRAALPLAGVIVVCCLMQSLVSVMEPKSSYPLLFLLTGNGEFGLTTTQIYQKVGDFYANLSLARFVDLKASQFTDLLWTRNSFFSRNFPGPFFPNDDRHFSVLGTIRAHEFFSLLPALGPGLVLGLLLVLRKRASLESRVFSGNAIDRQAVATVLVLAASSVATLVVFVLAFSPPMVVHHLPYGAIIAIALSMAAVISSDRRILRVATVVQIAQTVVILFLSSYYTWFHELLRQ